MNYLNFKSRIQHVSQWSPEVGNLFNGFLEKVSTEECDKEYIRREFDQMVDVSARVYHADHQHRQELDMLYNDMVNYYGR